MDEREQIRIKNNQQWYISREKDYEEFAATVLRKIKKALYDRNIIIAFSSSRAKSLKSFCDKCQKTIYDSDKEEFVMKSDPKNQIMDCAGVRIVTYLQSDIPLIQDVIENMFRIDYQNSQDKIKLLEDNKVGYLSIHYIASLKECSYEEIKYKDFKCEIQVRTILQDAWAQIFHDRQYKNNNFREIPESFENKANKFYNSKYCIQLIKDFGLNSIRELDNVILPPFVETIMKYSHQLTIDKLLMYILIVYNEEKYFSFCGENGIKEISKESFEILNGFINMEEICKKYDIKCSQE